MQFLKCEVKASWNPDVILTTYWKSTNGFFKIAKSPSKKGFAVYDCRGDTPIFIGYAKSQKEAEKLCVEKASNLPW